MDLGLRGKAAIVTGATAESPAAPAGGIGCETARLLVQEGARVVLADIDDERGEALAEELRGRGGEALFVHTDVSRPGEVRNLVDKAIEAMGTVNILVNNAGCRARQGTAGDFPNIDLKDWDFIFDVHLKGTLNCVQEVARRVMIPNRIGRIVNVSSIAGHGRGGAHPYGVAKAAISYFTQGVAAKLGPYGINVNCVSPGNVVTPIYQFEEMSSEEIERMHKRITEERMLSLPLPGTGKDIAKVILFLVSDLGRYVTADDINASAGTVVY